MIDIKISSILAMGYDEERHVHHIVMSLKPAHGEMMIKRSHDVSEEEYIAICGWLQLNLTHGYKVSKVNYNRVVFETCSFLLTGSFDDIARLRERTSTFIQQEWRVIADINISHGSWEWQSTARDFGFVFTDENTMALYYNVRKLAKRVEESCHVDLAAKLMSISESPLFPMVDYELQLRWRSGQIGLETGYATVARVDKNDIRDLGKRLGAK